MNVNQILINYEQARTDRAAYEEAWQAAIEYIEPSKAFQFSQGNQFRRKIFDNTAKNSLELATSALFSSIVSPQVNWLNLSIFPEGEEGNEDEEILEWLQRYNKVLLEQIENSNFYQTIYQCFSELLLFGVGVFYIIETEKDNRFFTCYTVPLPEVFIVRDAIDNLSMVFRKVKLTAHQMYTWWENKVSESVIEINKIRPLERYEVINATYKNNKKGNYKSVWIEYNTQHVIETTTYNEMPYIVATWGRNPGETYATGMGVNALPFQRTVNLITQSIVRIGQRIADPPTEVPIGDFITRITPSSLAPGSMLFKRRGAEGTIRPIDTGARNIPILYKSVQDGQRAIEKMFNADRLNIIDKNRMTATEIIDIRKKNADIFGPGYMALEREFLPGVISTIIGILSRIGNILPIPPEGLIEDRFLIPRYRSTLDVAKQEEERKLIRFLDQVYSIDTKTGEGVERVGDNINPDKVIDVLAKLENVPREIFNKKIEVENKRERRRKFLEQQQQQQQAMQAVAAEGI